MSKFNSSDGVEIENIEEAYKISYGIFQKNLFGREIHRLHI